MGSVALAAKVGSRLAHAALPMVMPTAAMTASAMGAHVVGPAGFGGAGAAAMGAGIGCGGGMSMISLMDMIPILTTGAIVTGAFDVMLGPGQMAVLAPSLPQPCAPHLAQPIAMGSPTVSIHGMQLVRVGDKTTCGAFVCDGVKTVMVGGAGAPAAPVSTADAAGALGGAALGALLGQTGAVQAVNEFGAALLATSDKLASKVDDVLDKGLDAMDKTLDAAAGVVDKVAGTAGAVLGKVGDMVGTVGGAVEAILGGASLTK
jgi:uncharacterized Zn-binding protein involved in type VI secretion